jgi:hypothetical protein
MTKANTTRTLEQLYSRITATIGLTLLAAIFSNPALARPLSSFQTSCRNVSLRSNVLSATCRTRDGRSEVSTSVVLRGINNRDGGLVDDGSNTPASFQKSCIGAKAVNNDLFANCFRTNGKDLVFNQFRIQGIRNDNGKLKY